MDEQLNANSPISDFENVVSTNDIENPAPQLTLPAEGQFQPVESFLAPTVEDQQNEQQVQQQQSNVDQILSSIESSFGNLATQGATQVQMEEQAGIGTMSKELTDVENEIRKKSLAFRREQEAIQTVPGLTVAQRAARLRDVSRINNMELADLEVIRQARSNSLANAQSLIDRKIELQFGDERRRLEGLQFIYNENKDKLTQKQNELLQSKIKKEERAFELAKGKYQTLEETKMELVRNAQANGAGNGVMSAILKSQTLEDAYRNAGSYGVSIDDKIRQMQLQKARAELNASGVSEEDAESAIAVSETIQDIDSLLQEKNTLFSLVGGSKLGTRRLFSKTVERRDVTKPQTVVTNAKRADFIATVDQLTSQLTINKLIEAKQNGATFGSLTEGERNAIAASASRIAARAITDKNGKTVGYRGTEAEFEEDLRRIQNYAKRDYERRTGLPFKSLSIISFDENGFIEVPDEFISNEQFFQ